MTPRAGFARIAGRPSIGSERGCREFPCVGADPGGPHPQRSRPARGSRERNRLISILSAREGGLGLGAAPKDLNVFERV